MNNVDDVMGPFPIQRCDRIVMGFRFLGGVLQESLFRLETQMTSVLVAQGNPRQGIFQKRLGDKPALQRNRKDNPGGFDQLHSLPTALYNRKAHRFHMHSKLCST